jgi:ABC-2 type transport system ATP-binding protein
MLEVAGISRSYDELRAVDDVSFTVERGTSFGLLGPNGAGKTTAISIIAGLLEPDEGKVTLGGTSMLHEPLEAKRKLGLVPQEIALYPTLSALENLDFWGRLYGLGGEQLRSRAAEVLEVVGLSDRQHDRVENYSGGMKRRLNIAVGLLHEPELLILDEPTVGVDPQSRHHILESVHQLQQGGLTVLYTSHYMEEVEKLCDRVAVMDEGRVIAMGTIEELHSRVEEDRVVHLTPDTALDREEFTALIQESVRDAAGQRWHNNTLQLLVPEGIDFLPSLLERLQEEKVHLRSLHVEEPDLESLFLKLTGKQLRD